MSVETAPGDVEEFPCVNHPRATTAVACGKCGAYLCPKCMIFTPVGVRCRPCAQLRKAPQFDVSLARLFLAGAVGLGTSLVAWFIGLQVVFFVWIVAVLVGLSVGEVTSRVAKRRVNRSLEVIVGADIVLGYLAVATFGYASRGFGYHPFQHGFASVTVALNDPVSFLLVALAIVFGVARLRR